jgi:hypothetical protein
MTRAFAAPMIDSLGGAAAVELQDVDAATAAGYLTRVQLDPLPPGWRKLTERLRPARMPVRENLADIDHVERPPCHRTPRREDEGNHPDSR